MHRDTPSMPRAAAAHLDAFWARIAAAGDGAATPEALADVAAAVSGIARAEEMLPEHLVIALKDSWASSPALRSRPERALYEWVLTDLVTRAIRAYFVTPPSLPTVAPRTLDAARAQARD